MTFEEILINGGRQLDLELNMFHVEQFNKYKDLLLDWNEKINLTSITAEEEIAEKHFIDSLTLLSTGLIFKEAKMIDIGTGAGFPGIPLKILNRDIRLTLLDSLKKRVIFLEHLKKELSLDDLQIIHGRAEDYGVKEGFRESFDIAVSRAVATLNILAEYCLPFVKVGGYFLAMKGHDIQDEIEAAKNALKILGGEVYEVKNIKILSLHHTIVVIKKIFDTPSKYPRKAGKPEKHPL